MKRKLFSIFCAAAVLMGLLGGCGSGVVGIREASINSNGELILYYTDGTSQNLGKVTGSDGRDGKDGLDGTDGKTQLVSGVEEASTKALRSVVAITAGFTKFSSKPSNEELYYTEGSGVIYQLDRQTGNALILTNYHVVYDKNSSTGISQNLMLYLYGADHEHLGIPAEYIGGSMYYDLAVLQVKDCEVLKGDTYMAATLSDSEQVTVGSVAIVAGNPKGYGFSATSGVINVDSEYVDVTAANGRTSVTLRVIRVDAAVNSGNSGGGLFNDAGELIGIVSAKVAYEGVDNIGYAIPINLAVTVAENILYYCLDTDLKTVQRPELGITTQVSQARAVYDEETGGIRILEEVTVSKIKKGSLSEGIVQEGDRLIRIAVNGKEQMITRKYHGEDLVLEAHVGDVVYLTVEREGQILTLELEITVMALNNY